MAATQRTATVRKCFTFDAAHQLPNHGGKCRHPHGHTYKVEVALTGPMPRRP
jgi:6-pyruvoyltetrahydropterin/6-carboxytetrahydropterin synthase